MARLYPRTENEPTGLRVDLSALPVKPQDSGKNRTNMPGLIPSSAYHWLRPGEGAAQRNEGTAVGNIRRHEPAP